GIYYLFTMEEQEFDIGGRVASQPQGRGLSYFVIDMNLNGGLGGVTDYREQILIAYEALDATPMADGTGYWIVCHDNSAAGSGRLFLTPLTAQGVGTPVTVPLDFPTGGRLEFSPDGRYLYHNGRLLAFDNADGRVGDILNVFPNASSAACFTPDSRFLFYTEGRPALGTVVLRYDLSDFSRLDVGRLTENPADVSLQTTGFQMAPDGNIYFVEELISGPDRRYGLSQLTCVSSPTPELNRFLIDLPSSADAGFQPQSLPQYVDAIFQTPPVADTLRLDTLGSILCGDSLRLQAREVGTDYRWSDGSTADSLVVRMPGTYCVTVTGGCQPVVDCQTVRARFNLPEVTLGEPVDLGCEGLLYPLSLTPATPLPDSIVVTYARGSVGTPQPYLRIVVSEQGNDVPEPRDPANDRVTVQFFTPCGRLDTPLDFPEITRFSPFFTAESSEPLCNGLPFDLSVDNAGSLAVDFVRWSDGNTDNPRRFVASPDSVYRATVFSECGDSTELTFTEPIAEFCDCRAVFPELITPNGDGTNDVFRIFSNCPATDFQLLIFNRWGQEAFSSSDPDRGWDGTRDGTPQNMGTYLYRAAYRLPGIETLQIAEGQFSLVR
ncbi:MAG: gliding motility-associated C-terminal domain-containing protein, partial [Bacteroidota bacterium]